MLVGAIWRRSLQVRVVVSTLALSAAVVLVLGLVLQTQIARPDPAGQGGRRARPGRGGCAPCSSASWRASTPTGEGAQGELNKALDRLTNASLSDDAGSPSAGEFRAVLTTGPREPGRGVDGPGRTRCPRAPSRTSRRTCAGTSPEGRWPAATSPISAPGRRDPHSDHRSAGAHRGPRPGVLPAVPARRRAAHALAGAEHADRRRPRAAPAARRDREPRHPPGGPAGAAGRRDRRAVRRRAPRRAHAGARRRRGGAAGRVVQRDGRAASRPRSASSRSSARCSGGSPPTSATSCAPR